MMQHQVAPPLGARKERIRGGRGSSGRRGNHVGRGMNGQKSRPGRGPRVGFEGGQLPLIKGLPALRGFTNNFKTYYSIVNLKVLERFDPEVTVTPQLLLQNGYLRNLKQPVKILGDGEISRPLTVVAHRFTRSARAKIQAAGGKAEELTHGDPHSFDYTQDKPDLPPARGKESGAEEAPAQDQKDKE